MAHRRGGSGRSAGSYSLSSPLPRKKYSLRRTPPNQSPSIQPSAGPIISSDASRGPLLPLQPNLRRLPSRFAFLKGPDSDSDSMQPPTGAKRKRNENSRLQGRPDRGSGRPKRLKAANGTAHIQHSDSDSDTSRDANESEDDEGDYRYLHNAPSHELHRLRKDQLLRLYHLAGLGEGDDSGATKNYLVDAILEAREDVADLPPSSPRGDGSSSGYSSDENPFDSPVSSRRPIAGGLRRRATHNGGEIARTMPRPAKNRTMSWNVPELTLPIKRKPFAAQPSLSSPPMRRHRTTSSDGHPSESASTPLVARLRSRKNSTASSGEPSTPTRPNGLPRRPKQVEFTNSALQLRTQRDIDSYLENESDLTDIEADATPESSASGATKPSPRRLRSKDRKEAALAASEESNNHLSGDTLDRRTSLRKRKSSPLVEESLSQEDEEDSQADIDEVDELISAVSTPQHSRRAPPPIVDRTPVKRRLRSSGHLLQAEAHDADDEDEDPDADESADEDELQYPDIEPGRRLRNGKIVAEDEDVDMVTADEESVTSDDAQSAASEDEELEQDEDEAMPDDEDIDLEAATAKTLVRLRRDDLVRLCESRELDAAGTKPQLAEALLEWRDTQQRDFSEPSSVGTVRPPSTVRRPTRRGGRRHSSSEPSTPLLLQNDPPEMNELDPKTPPPKESEPELELDLESLGLDDREIPSDKLVKLEKIGSGGFKDVFIGKLRGRKVAIAEFRGQLNAMDIKELKLLGEFNHPNIVRFHGVSIPENTRDTPVMIVSELCSNGDLFDYVRNVPPPSLHRVLSMMLDIAKGIQYLHNCKPSIIHRDCKSSNILITSKGTAKITDFGLAKVKQSTRSMVRSLVGTVNWQAPELWSPAPKYNHKVDVFSLAVVYWEMLQWHVEDKKYPWEGMNEHAIYEAVGQKHQRPSMQGLRKLWCPEIVELVQKMWAQEPADRPTITEVVDELEELLEKYS